MDKPIMGNGESGGSRIAVLDGIRGVAILMVLVNHFMPNRNYASSHVMAWLNNVAQSGWAGVDVFFVLSGFLITRLLIDTKRSPSYFRNFYMRRVLRIFPLYYGTLVVVFVVLPSLGVFDSKGFDIVWANQFWNWAYLTNLGMWVGNGVGFSSPEINLSHFWSLAIEEHFYLVWPMIVFALSFRRVKWFCLTASFVVLTGRVIAVTVFDSPHLFFFQSWCRADSLLLGGLVGAMSLDGTLIRFRRWLFAVGIVTGATLVAMFVKFRSLPARDPLMHSFGYSFIAITACAFMVMALTADGNNWLRRILESRALRFFGTYSYGLYVIHGVLSPSLQRWMPDVWFIGVTNSIAIGAMTCMLARIVLCTGLAVLSWHFFEKRFLRLKRHFTLNPAPEGSLAIVG